MAKKRHQSKQSDTRGDSDSDSGSAGGKSGSIEFRDFVTGNASLRDDQLPPDELRRMRAVHLTAHELRVKKQKELRETRQQLKEGKISLEHYRENLAAEKSSNYPPHPALANKAQFAGIDKQENQIPSLNETQTNDENRNELENRYQNKYQPEMGKKFNPKPQFR